MNNSHGLARALTISSWASLALVGGLNRGLAQVSESAANRDANLAVQEVVVTARKREESARDVPISITAFTGESLDRMGIESIYDIAKVTPGLSFNQSYGRMFDRPVIRGMSQILGERTVSFVVDGVYIAGNITGADLDDLEAVEVLKGPQAATFGRGSLAGVISYRTRRPSNVWTGRASLTAGNDDYREAVGSISGPILDDRLSFKLGARYYDYAGHYEGPTNDGRTYTFGAERTKRVSGALRWDATDTVDITVRAFAARNTDGLFAQNLFQTRNCFVNTDVSGRRGSYCGVIPTIGANGAGLGVDLSDAERQGRPGTDTDTNLYSAEAHWRLGSMTLTGLVSWNRQDDDFILDDYIINSTATLNGSQTPSPTMTNPSPGQIARLITVRDYRSQELRLASTGEGRFQWLIGLYHFDEARKGFFGFARYNVINPMTGVPLATNNGPVGTLRDFSQPLTPFGIDNEAAFASVSYDIDDRWHVSLEGRYSQDVLTTDNTNQVVPAPNPLGRGTFCDRQLDAEYKSFTPRGTVRFDFSEDKNAYFSVSRGNKPGDFNLTLCSANFSLAEAQRLSGIAPLGVEEEESLNYELGSKMRFLDGRLALDAAVFFVDWKNQQVTLSQVATNAVTGLPASASLILNAGATTVKGFEISGQLRLNANWNFNLGYGYTDAKFDRFCDATFAQISGVTTQTGPCAGAASVPTLSVAGYHTANAPKHNGTIGVDFGAPISDRWEFFARFDTTYQSERFAEVYNLASTGDATRFDLRFGLARDQWRFTAWARNIGNERAPDGATRAFNPDDNGRAWQVHYPLGRQIGLTAAFDF